MQYRIQVQVHGGKDITSQPLEEAQAQADLDQIADAQRTGEFCKLTWLAIEGNNILSVHMQPYRPPAGPAVA